MGGIDEAALDRLSLVTEMTKHIRVRASGGRSTASELGQFSPVFVWLLRVRHFIPFILILIMSVECWMLWLFPSCVSSYNSSNMTSGPIMHQTPLVCNDIVLPFLQDFYLDLTEDNRKITPRDYLELALRPVQGGGRDVSAKNAVW